LTVLDAYAVIAFFRAEPAAGAVRPLLKRPGITLTTVGVAVVLDHLIRIVGVDEENATLDVAQLGLLDGIPVSPALGAAAGRLLARRYHRSRCPVSIADCIAAEAARSRTEPLATSDPDLLDLCHVEDIARIVLPRSDGSVWTRPSRIT
jgi:predicted nucleic acid-binding protein